MCLFETGWWNWRVDVESCGFGVLVLAYATRNWMRMEREPVLPIFVKLHNPTQPNSVISVWFCVNNTIKICISI